MAARPYFRLELVERLAHLVARLLDDGRLDPEPPLHELQEQRSERLEPADAATVGAIEHRDERLRLGQVVGEQHAPRVATAIVEVVLEVERAPALLRIGRVQRWLRPPKLDRLDDLRRVTDRAPVHLQDRHRTAGAQASRGELLQAWRHRAAYVGDTLVVARPSR